MPSHVYRKGKRRDAHPRRAHEWEEVRLWLLPQALQQTFQQIDARKDMQIQAKRRALIGQRQITVQIKLNIFSNWVMHEKPFKNN